MNLDVYDTKEGLWDPVSGALDQPEGWEFLPSGDAFVTRRVKAAGVYWKLWRSRGRNRPHRRLLGLLVPAAAIEAAQAEAASSEAARSGRRAQGAAYRARKEDIYRQELTEAIIGYLGFAPEHDDLAQTIAAEAARALIRHRYTDYEDCLLQGVWDDDFLYREVKAEAHRVVDDFLDQHRPAS
jgi:hypothetical protein